MKAISIDHPELGPNKLEMKVSSFLGNPKLYYNGILIPKRNKTYSISEKLGKPFDIELKNNTLDVIPKVIINKTTIDIVEPLKLYGYIWMALPIILVLVGGALGAIFGIIAYKANISIFRSNKKVVEKYLFTLILNIIVIVTYLVIAMLVSNAAQAI